MATIYSPDDVFAVGVSVNTTSRDMDTLNLLEISMATYNNNFTLLNQTTAVISNDPRNIMLNGEIAKIYTNNGLLDDIDHGEHTPFGVQRYLTEWLADQLAHNEYAPHLFSDDLEFTRKLLRHHMPEILDYLDARPIDATTVKLLAEAQGRHISLPERTHRAEDNVQHAAGAIVQGYINADTTQTQTTTSKRVEQYTLPGTVIDTLSEDDRIASHVEITQYDIHRNNGVISASAVLAKTDGDNVTVTVDRLSHGIVDISTNTGKRTKPKRIHFTGNMTYDDFFQQVYTETLAIAHDAINE
jgi:oligoribonuclease (3'-5' exoribonuclease)